MPIRESHSIPHLPDPQSGAVSQWEQAEAGFNGLILVYLIYFTILSFFILSLPKAYLRIPVRSKSYFESWKLK